MFAVENGLEQAGVIPTNRSQGPIPPPQLLDHPVNSIQQPVGRRFLTNHRKRIQIARVGRPAQLNSATDISDASARARALHDVAENSALIQQEFNRAFVLMEYFGYLRRNPNDDTGTYTGYDFWLTKLNQFNGDFQKAEMVKAFITSGEYRSRFGQP